jgi:hypothetical protein
MKKCQIILKKMKNNWMDILYKEYRNKIKKAIKDLTTKKIETYFIIILIYWNMYLLTMIFKV